MNIWLVTTGEPLPHLGERPHRIGMLSTLLAARGHQVLWWTTSFDHQKKVYLYQDDVREDISDCLELQFMHASTGYQRNISFARLFNHGMVARKFRRLSQNQTVPDLIVCSYPTIELSAAVVDYGKQHHIPVVLDVRDLWPDIFLDAVPELLKGLARLALRPYFLLSQHALSSCDGVVAVSDVYLSWALQRGQRQADANCVVLPLGYDVAESDGPSEEEVGVLLEKGLDTSKTLLWFVGTFGRTYDLETVIKGAKLLSRTHPDVQVVLTGDGEQMPRLRKLAQGASNIVFTGWVDKVQISYLSSVADIGLMAYLKGAPQGLPNKIFEYMSAQLPILSCLDGETRFLLEENDIGRHYAAGDSNDFVRVLDMMLSSKAQLKQWGRNGKAIFMKDYAAHIVYQRYIDYLEDLLRSHNKDGS